MQINLVEFYTEKRDSFIRSEAQLTKKIKWIAFFRLLAFSGIALSLIYLTRFGVSPGVLAALLSLAFFLFLVKRHIRFEKLKKRYGILSGLAEDELKALNHDFSHFNNGKEFINPGHDFSYDLDLFGEGSLFQFVNRTSTRSGEKKLAALLISPPIEKEEIEKRQDAIKELSGDTEWRMQFSASGNMFNETERQHDEVATWSEKELKFNRYGLIGYLRWVIPAITLASFLPGLLGGLWLFLAACVFVQLSFVYFYRHRIKEYFRFFGEKSLLIEKYVNLLSEIEKRGFSSEWLKEMQQAISSPSSACKIIKELGSLVKEFEFGRHLLVGLFLNSIFLWDVRYIYNLRKWHLKNRGKLIKWLGVIENIDAVISLANFSDNNPGFVYPQVNEGRFIFESEQLGHPLLNPRKRVCSDFKVGGFPEVIIVTGANMAGKSTFLRTVGVNMVLSRLGAPVCATKYVFTPIGLYTNMRTTDSLLKDESYFFAELKRLSFALERLRSGEELFVILDEILKGTNSADKLNGSKELVKQLAKLKAVTLIATHDLKLAEIGNELPPVKNKCFEIHIKGDELTFDYRLTEGVTKSMNATFLMKKMGII